MTRVSVVVPAFNSAATIAAALQSVLAQTHTPFEIIVVDDGSEDGTVREALAAAPTARIVRQDHGGAGRARNTGTANASGDLVAFLDSDDVWEPSKLAHQVSVLDANREVDAAVSNWRRSDRPGRGLGGGELPLRPTDCGRVVRGAGDDVFRYAFAMVTSTICARRAVLQRFPFDPRLATAEDRDVWVRLVSAGQVWFDSEVLATVHYRSESLTHADAGRDAACMLEVLTRYAHLASPAAMRRWQARTYAKWAGALLSEGRHAEACRPAWERCQRDPWSPEAWWTLAKSRWRLGGRHRATP